MSHADPADPVSWRTEITGRVSDLEDDIGIIKTSQGKIEQGQADMGRSLDQLARDIRDSQAASRKPTNWSALIALLSLVAIVGGAYTNMLLSPVKDTVAGLDIKLQKEYTLANDTIRASVQALNEASKERHDNSQLAITRMREDFSAFAEHGSPELRERVARTETALEYMNKINSEQDRHINVLESNGIAFLEKSAYQRGKTDEMAQHLQNVDAFGPRHSISVSPPSTTPTSVIDKSP